MSAISPLGDAKNLPPVIGLVGGVASGKSSVAEAFRRLGAAVLDADKAGYEVLCEPAVEEAARQRWGEAVFGADGHLSRAAVAARVFAPPPAGPLELEFLESVTHPRIAARLERQLRELQSSGRVRAIILDAPVMIKAGWNKFCNCIVFVEAPRAQRLERARLRGWSEKEFDHREAAQESLDAKRARADVVIDNSGSLDSTARQVESIWRQVVERLPPA